MHGRVRILVLCVVTAAGAHGVLADSAQSVVPPRDCGRMTVKGSPYQVKVDQITCAQGRRFGKSYLVDHVKPSGYRCRDLPSRVGRVRVYCSSGRRVFFLIRR